MLCKRFVHQIQRVFGVPEELSDSDLASDIETPRVTDRKGNDGNSDDYY